MSVVIILIAASLSVATGFLIAFIWSVKSGQYDDDYTPSVRMLFEDGPHTPTGHTERPIAKGRSVIDAKSRVSTPVNMTRELAKTPASDLKNIKPTQ